ncbi:uncharacterized protein SOCE26_013700 [Sorangium cellulosum]|uniref:Right handed beta helix domain-containing protein n=2 Tax=Sorangium cellulosum TaxID=56 RepID=A0A2L0EL07_SORCE|nr:uncharacterized protein SOCE26_013700 [Sorangium cellulosum]
MVNMRERTVRWGLAEALLWALAIALVLIGCGERFVAAQACAPGAVAREDGACEPAPCGPDEVTLETGECQPAGLPPDMPCPPGQVVLEGGRCQPAGVPPEACAEGFVPDGGGGCAAILPREACPEGQMAIPGETRCREVAPCGDGRWGDIPVEENTQFVDQAYTGGDSDGTAARPWTTIQRGINNAESGAIVAVAAGSYVEDVVISGKAVRLWGRCPALVEVRGTGGRLAAVQVLRARASGTEIRSLAATGTAFGLFVSGARDVTIDQAWVHDVNGLGVAVEDAYGSTSVALRSSLVEQSRGVGVYVYGSHATVEHAEIRSTKPNADGSGGWGIGLKDDAATGERASASVRGCVVEQNHQVGVYVYGSDAAIEASVVRDTQPGADGTRGWGIGLEDNAVTGERASVSIVACVVQRNHEAGVRVYDSDAAIEATVVRDTQPNKDGMEGWGLLVEQRTDSGERASVTVRACLVDHNRYGGVVIVGADATIEASVVRGTLPSEDGRWGRGVNVQNGLRAGERASLAVRGCLIEKNHELGLYVHGSDATVEASVIRGTLPGKDGTAGQGIGVRYATDTGKRASVRVRACLIEQNHEVGVLVSGSDAIIEASVVRGTQPDKDGTAGRGISVRYAPDTHERAGVTVRACLIEQNHEVGVLVSGSDAIIEASVVRGTQPNRDGAAGRGISVRYASDTGQRASVTIRECVIQQNHEVGVYVRGSDATIVASVIRATQPRADGKLGGGIVAVDDDEPGERARLTVRACLVEQNHDVGILVSRSDAMIEDAIIRKTKARADKTFGDGFIVESSIATIRDATINDNARAGVANFGSTVTILSTILTCNALQLNGEEFAGLRASFDGSIDWRCTRRGAEDCTETDDRCHASSAGLEPPPEEEMPQP